MLKIFLSYAHEDYSHAERLYNVLDSIPAIDVWMDKKSLLPGQKWEQAIRKAIRESRYFLVLLSRKSTEKKGFYQREIREALKVLEEYPDDEIYLIPARLEKCQPHFDQIDAVQYVDLFPDWDNGVTNILRALRSHERPETAPAKSASLRFTSHQARFVSNPKMYYFITITNMGEKPVEVTHLWYEDATNHIPVRPESRQLPKRLKINETWASWIPISQVPEAHRILAYDLFKLRLSTGEIARSRKEDTVPPYGSVPGGEIIESDIETADP